MIQGLLIEWYQRNRRDLPWRVSAGHPDPYHVLVSELMLQQTQVATVIPYFRRFIERFPTIADLAAADEQELLRLWQGLGYYSRARNLQKAARVVIADHGGCMPASVEELLRLPGVGRYTAGAIASLAFGRREPILDGNVQRVLCRLKCIGEDPRGPEVQARLWQLAREMLPDSRVAEFNSALMELGATVCTPRAPKCLLCPVKRHCQACAEGRQEDIPPARKASARPLVRRWVLCVEHGGRWLIEQRPSAGRWADMWQFVTLPRGRGVPDAASSLGVPAGRPRRIGTVKHDLTHRRYEFTVYACQAKAQTQETPGRKWLTPGQLHQYPLPRPHVLIAGLLNLDGFAK